MADLLKVASVSAGYGDVQVLHEVSLVVQTGEIDRRETGIRPT